MLKIKLCLSWMVFQVKKIQPGSFSKSRKPLYKNPLRKAEALAEKGALAVIVMQRPADEPLTLKYENLMNALEAYHIIFQNS